MFVVKNVDILIVMFVDKMSVVFVICVEVVIVGDVLCFMYIGGGFGWLWVGVWIMYFVEVLVSIEGLL